MSPAHRLDVPLPAALFERFAALLAAQSSSNLSRNSVRAEYACASLRDCHGPDRSVLTPVLPYTPPTEAS